MENALALALGYLLGSIPFGLIFTRLAGLGDIRRIGSGNIGATNVLRTGRKGLALATLLADAGKGAAAVLIAGQWGEMAALLAGLGAFLGHLFPVWLQFRGGKGVATYIGVLTAIKLWGLAIFAGLWLAVAVLTRFSSLAALTAALVTPIAFAWMGTTQTAAILTLMSVLLYIRHKANIARLLKGEEPRIGQRPDVSH